MTEPLMGDLLPTGPSSDGVDAPFWEGLRQDVLTLPKCDACGTWREPGRIICPECHDFATSWEAVNARGVVYSWARSHRDFVSELDVRAPYITVLVQLDEAPVRLLGILEGAEAIEIGDRMNGVVRRPLNAEWPILRWRAA